MYESMSYKQYQAAQFKRYPDANFTNFTMSTEIEQQILDGINLFQTIYNNTRGNWIKSFYSYSIFN
jgi:hypothetical protein